MSKYIKLEDAIEAYNQAVTNLVESEMEEFDLGDFTECSFDTTQIKLIKRMIASLPTIDIAHCEECKYAEKCEQIAVFDIGENQIEGRKIDFCSYGERIEQ